MRPHPGARFAKAWRIFDENVEKWLIVPTYGYFCLIILVEVIRRYVLADTSVWGEMTARYAFVYLVYIAAAEAARTRSHVHIDLVPRLVGSRARFFLYVYFDVLHLVLAILVIRFSLQVMEIQISANILMTGFDVNMAFAQAALPLGWGLLAYRVMQRFVKTLSDFRQGREVALGRAGFSE